MLIIILLAATLALIGVGVIATRLLKSRPTLIPAVWTALACAGVLVLGSTILYASLSPRSSPKSPAAGSPTAMVERLVHELHSRPRDLNGWLLLGRSYLVLREYPLAVSAYQRADRLSGGANVDAMLGEAQALMLSSPAQLMGRAGSLIERALVLAPSDPQALYFGGIVAMHRGQLALARARFRKLLTLNPPANIRRVAQAQIVSIDRQLGNSRSVAEATHRPAERPDANETLIRVDLELAPALAKRAPSGVPLYVFVRDAAQPGPPLAVKRLRSHFPQTVTLTPADSMIAGHTFTSGEHVQIVARVAPSGDPLDAKGDLSGQATYRVGGHNAVEVLIDRVTR